MGDALGHQLVLDVYEQVDEPLRSELGVWSLLYCKEEGDLKDRSSNPAVCSGTG